MTGGTLRWRLWSAVRLLGVLALAAGAVLLWRLACLGYSRALLWESHATLRCDNAPILAGDYREMWRVEQLAEQPAAFALWTQTDGQWVSDPLTRRGADTAVVQLRGESRLALPVSEVLAEGDLEGCLIDAQTASALFGWGGDAAGAEIIWDEERYVVRGVFAAPAGTVLVWAKEDVPLPNVTVAGADSENSFAMRHDLEVTLTARNSFYLQLGAVLSGLPALAALGVAAGLLGGLRGRNRLYPVRDALLLAALLGVATAAFLYLLHLLPSDWTPGKWSDFSFWNTAFSNWRREATELFAARKYRRDLLLLSLVGRCGLGAVSAWLLWCAWGWQRWTTYKLLAWGGVHGRP